ncbi:MAG: hypothetical protein ACD_11C00018G0011 [uncultured bacterium]|nr:MAG: hypothetical protein ACD_11C00018G0011 [uncultured bacterium]HBR71537.1 hypothetical protein [Candidatus Moranbacteria bacterium]
MFNKYIAKKNILIAIFIILTVLIFFKLFSLLAFPDSEIVLEKEEDMQLKEKQSLQQKFIAKYDGLMRIQVLMRHSGINKGNIIKMQIADENCANIIFENELEKGFLSSENLHIFNFPKINNSKEKTFCLIATLEEKKDKNARFFTNDKNYFSFPLEKVSTEKEASGQQLSMRPVYKNTGVLQDLRELNQRISQYKPFFLKHYYLWAIIILFLFLSIGLVIILTAI